jgi:hypothetical protein
VRAYKLTVYVIDFDGVGEHIPEVIENQKYPNHCISPSVAKVESADIGTWHDEHPLNHGDTAPEEWQRLFPETK